MKTLIFKFAFLSTVFLLGAFASVSEASSKKTELKIGIAQEFDSLNPVITNMVASTYVLAMVNRSLMIVGENGELIPQLVQEIPTLENGLAKMIGKGSQRKIQATWKIREKAKWGDGQPVTCRDLHFAWSVAMSGKIPVPQLRLYSRIQNVEFSAKKPKVCLVTYVGAEWDFNRVGRLALLPEHIEGPIYRKFKDQPQGYTNNSYYSASPNRPALYNGPFVVQEVQHGSHMVLVRNPHFYGRKPFFEKVVLKLIPNTATLEANLLSGSIDMISFLGLTFDQALKFDKKIRSSALPYKVHFKPSLQYEHIDVNLEDEILKDLNVRKALVHGTDRKTLTQTLFEGRQPPALHFISPQDPWFTDDRKHLVTYRYSSRKAKKLLESAGWKVAEDGYRVKNGKRLQVTIMSTSGNKLRELVEVFLKAQWKKIGVELLIKNFPPRVFFGEYVRKAKFPNLAMYAFVNEPESNPRANLHSLQIPRKSNGYAGINRMKWKNRAVDELIEKLENEFVHKKRVGLMREILFNYTNEIPAIPLYYRSDVAVTPVQLKGYRLTGNSFSAANNIENWQF